MYGVDYICVQFVYYPFRTLSRRGRDRMVVGFTTKTTDTNAAHSMSICEKYIY
jgi:hypothetical protein